MTSEQNQSVATTRVLVILGMHRSGTSALARICNLMGAELGADLMLPGEDNPAGFWENRLVYEFNQQLLQHMGMDWDHPGPIPARGWHGEDMEPFYRRARKLLEGQFAGAGFICIKDPRLSRLLPFWRRVWREMNWEPFYLFCVRDPAEVAASLARRNQTAIPHGELLWLRYYSEAERNTRFRPRALIDYADLLEDWQAALREAWRTMGLDWQTPSPQLMSDVEESLQPALRHHKAPGSDAERASAGLTREIYADLRSRGDTSPNMTAFNARILRQVDWTLALLMAQGSRQTDWTVWCATLEALLQGAQSGTATVSGDSPGEEPSADLIETLLHRINDLQATIHRIQGVDHRSSQLEKELEEVREAWQWWEAEAEKRLVELDRHKNELQATKRHAGVLGRHAMEQEKILRERQAELEAAVIEKNQLYASRSWRITAPLRAASKRLSRVRGNPFSLVRFPLKLVWRALPLPAGFRWRVRIFLCRWLPFLMRGTWAYSMYSGGTQKTTGQAHSGLEWPPATHWPAIMAEPEISVILPVYNNWPLTRACLESIRRQGARRSFEVVVVDDASTDGTAGELDGCEDLIVVHNEENQGFIGSCNRGAHEANGDYLVLLNNDTEVHAGWLDFLHGTFQDHYETGLVGAQLLYPNGTLQEAGGIVWRDGNGWNYGRGNDAGRPEYNYLRDVDYCSGACLMVKRRLFHELGGFDDHYTPAYYEDTDLAFQVRGAGKRVLYQPLAQVTHREGGSNGTNPSGGIKRHQTMNRKRFLRRWKEDLADHGSDQDDFTRSRQRNLRGRVLIIDTITPMPDCDSGSNDAINLMRILTQMRFQVSFIPDDNLAYFGRYTDRLRALGVECWHVPYLKSVEDHLKEYGSRYDVVILSRVATASRQMETARQYCPQAKIVFNTVDLNFLRERRELELTGSSSTDKRVQEAVDEELALMEAADQTWVISPAEQALLQEENAELNVVQLPLILGEAETGDADFQQRRDVFFLGGYQHPPNVDAVKWFVGEVWPQVSPCLPEGVRLHIIGSHMPEEIRELAADDVVIAGFVPDVDGYIANMRLSVAPLRYGAGLKGKVARSLMHGIPCVASPMAAEGMKGEEENGIVVAATPEDYATLVSLLYNTAERWEEASLQARAFFQAHYSYAAGQERVADIIEQLFATDNDTGRTDIFEVIS